MRVMDQRLSSGVRSGLIALLIFAAGWGAPAAGAASRDDVVKIVAAIRRADYEGDRVALRRLYGELGASADDKAIGSRVLYWRGFALWRRAINGFNDGEATSELAVDVAGALEAFRAAVARDPAFVDAKVGAVACLGLQMFMNQKDTARVQELIGQSVPLMKEARAAEPDNPRLLWVLGPQLWWIPAANGGGQDKAIETYNKGLESARKSKGKAVDELEPSWGEPELLMSLAWSNLNKTTPDLDAAEKDAKAALELVPYWHYVRDILMGQIRDAKAKKG